MDSEEFFPLFDDGFPQYGVSKDGRVINFITGVEKKPYGGCVNLWKNNKQTILNIRKLVLKYHGSPIDEIPYGRKRNLDFLGLSRYTVTADGRLWNHDTCKWQALTLNQNGYIELGLVHDDGVIRHHKFHRLVAKAFIPNPENKPEVNHIDGNKLNNNVTNLEWNTAMENHRHARETGLRRKRLSDKEVHDICKRLVRGESDMGIAKAYNIPSMLVWYIKHGGHHDISSQYGFEKNPQKRLTPIDYAKYDKRRAEKVKALRSKLQC